MKYQKGDEVRIKGIDWYNKNKDKSGSVFANGIPFCEEMSEYCGAYVTIAEVYNDYYAIRGVPYCWTDGMIECLTDAHCKLGIVPTEKGSELIPREGFEIKQEGEKFYLVKKKKEYPKTYEECVHVLEGENRMSLEQMNTFRKLIDARNAYWKIAGEEMGLGEPWKPDYTNPNEKRFAIHSYVVRGEDGVYRLIPVYSKIGEWRDALGERYILEFPTEEMREAFYGNFKELIEQCKELL